METKNSNISVESVCKGIERKKYNFHHSLQRRAGQWNKKQKSLLIDSILRGYIIGRPIIARETDGSLSIIDGIQRLHTIYEFTKNEFKLTDLEQLQTGDETEYDLNGKKFSELPDTLRDKINDFQINMDVLTEWSYEELVDMFERCNSGKPLSRAQKMTAIFGQEFGEWLGRMMDKPFWRNTLSAAQVRASEDRQIILQVMMVLSGYDYKGFRNTKDIPEFVLYYRNNPNEELQQRIEYVLDDAAKYTWDKMPKKKLIVPLILLATDKIGTDLGKSRAFQVWLPEFYKSYSEHEDFLQYCRNATTSLENVNGRIDYFLSQVDNLEPLPLTEEEVAAVQEAFE